MPCQNPFRTVYDQLDVKIVEVVDRAAEAGAKIGRYRMRTLQLERGKVVAFRRSRLARLARLMASERPYFIAHLKLFGHLRSARWWIDFVTTTSHLDGTVSYEVSPQHMEAFETEMGLAIDSARNIAGLGTAIACMFFGLLGLSATAAEVKELIKLTQAGQEAAREGAVRKHAA